MPPRRGEPLACDDEALETARPHLRTDHLPPAAWTGRCRYVAADGTPLRGEASQRLAALAVPMRNLGDRARRRRSLHTAIIPIGSGCARCARREGRNDERESNYAGHRQITDPAASDWTRCLQSARAPSH